MNFNPDRAEEVDENSDESLMDSLMEQFEARAKKARFQVISDAFREMANCAKEERGKLLADAEAKFSSMVDAAISKASEGIHAQVAAKMQAEHNRLASRVERMLSRAQESAPKAPDVSSAAILDEVRACLNAMRETTTRPSETPIAIPAATPRPTSIKFERDDYGKITNAVLNYD